MAVHTLAQKTNLVLYATSGITREQAGEIAQMCLAAQTLGINDSVWHNTALYFRNGKNCNCAKCHPKNGAFSYRHVA